MPRLADIEAIASVAQSRTVSLSPMTLTVLFSILTAADRWYDWQGATSTLSDAERDEIDAFLSKARYELMTGSRVGEIIFWSGMDAPPNAIFCNGGTYTRADYPELYAAIDSSFHLDTETFFVPDLRGTFVRGGNSSSDVGTTGGEASHTLTESEIPSHSHTIPATATTLAVEPGEVTVLTPIPIITGNTGLSGGSGSHNNLPPYMTFSAWIIAR